MVSIQGHQDGLPGRKPDDLSLLAFHEDVVVGEERLSDAEDDPCQVVLGDVSEREPHGHSCHPCCPQHSADQGRGVQQLQSQEQTEKTCQSTGHLAQECSQERVLGDSPVRCIPPRDDTGEEEEPHDDRDGEEEEGEISEPNQELLPKPISHGAEPGPEGRLFSDTVVYVDNGWLTSDQGVRQGSVLRRKDGPGEECHTGVYPDGHFLESGDPLEEGLQIGLRTAVQLPACGGERHCDGRILDRSLPGGILLGGKGWRGQNGKPEESDRAEPLE